MNYYLLLVLFSFLNVAMCRHKTHKEISSTDLSTNETAQVITTTEIHSEASIVKDKVELKVFYETLCPASVQFYVEQLAPAVKRLGSHMDVHLVPYGGARTYNALGSYFFRCQHGVEECNRNMFHACSVDVLANVTHAILFNSCLMQRTSTDDVDYSASIPICTLRENVSRQNLDDIQSCANGTRGPELMKSYGDETWELNIRYVPYLLLDGSEHSQSKARKNLVNRICEFLTPRVPECPKLHVHSYGPRYTSHRSRHSRH